MLANSQIWRSFGVLHNGKKQKANGCSPLFITSERSADGVDFVFSECALLAEGAEFKQAFATVSARVFSCGAYFGADFRIFF